MVKSMYTGASWTCSSLEALADYMNRFGATAGYACHSDLCNSLTRDISKISKAAKTCSHLFNLIIAILIAFYFV